LLEACEERESWDIKKMSIAMRASNLKDKDFKKFLED
jgi:hypothetical protein